MHLRLLSVLWLIATILVAPRAFTAPRDKAANEKIDQAINQHYLNTEFDQAEAVLLGVIQACADKCSNSVKAKAWMYIGVVRGSGKDDQAGALQAFQQAVALDPSIALDEALATPPTKQTFQGVSPTPGAPPSATVPGAGAAPAAPATPGEPTAPAPTGAGAMLCTPLIHVVETRRSIPISCSTQAPAGGGRIFYQEVNNPEWKSVAMTRQGSVLQGTVPCAATGLVGKFNVYVEARNPQGAVVETMGTRAAPVEFTLVEKSAEPPPALPGQAPPARCEEDVCANAPPDFPGCEKRGNKSWGDSCASNDECLSAFCKAGTCDSCQTDDDCSAGTCKEGTCTVPGGGVIATKKKRQRFWVGLHVAGDIALVGGKNVCTDQVRTDQGYVCYDSRTKQIYRFNAFPNRYDEISSGMVYATTRVLASFDFLVLPQLSLGARVGFAFGGGPPTADKKAFFPVHLEGRVAYWFLPPDKRFRPYVHAGGGVAEVDSKNEVGIIDCAGPGQTPAQYPACVQGRSTTGAVPRNVDVYRKMGLAFATAGGGLQVGIFKGLALQLNVNAMLMLPIPAFVLEPSLGAAYGF